MHKTIFLVITDLHISYKNKDNRFNYEKEIDDILDRIYKLGLDYKKKGYDVNLIFLGDIIDNSYKTLYKAVSVNNKFIKFKLAFNNLIVVIGNHEFSFYTDNPFWTMMKEIKSEQVKKLLLKTWQPLGELQILDVYDVLKFGDSVFYFNHHPTPYLVPEDDGLNHFGFFHKDMVCRSILDSMKINKGLDVFEHNPVMFDKRNVLDLYDYAFVGHAHKIYGSWEFINDKTNYKTILYYLGSLGRPNHSEVMDNFLERNIPGIVFHDKKFIEIVDNKFNLVSREQSVKEIIVKENQVKYNKLKEKKKIINNTTYKPHNDSALNSLRGRIIECPQYIDVLEDILSDNYTITDKELASNYNKLIR